MLSRRPTLDFALGMNFLGALEQVLVEAAAMQGDTRDRDAAFIPVCLIG